MGRPSIYSEELVDTICTRIAEGDSLNSICKEKGFPSISTVFDWLIKKPNFSDKYAKAKEEQAEKYADEIVDIADKASSENVQVARLQIDTRKWVASKLKAKKYGDSTQIKHADADGEKLTGLDVSIIPSKHTDT